MKHAYTYLIEQIDAVINLPHKEQVEALRRSSKCLQQFLLFVYGNHTFDLDLPTDLNVVPISHKPYSYDVGMEELGDLLAYEISKDLTRILVPSQNPRLTTQRRATILIEILSRLNARERDVLRTAIYDRVVVGLPRTVAEEVFGAESFARPLKAVPPVPGYASLPSALDGRDLVDVQATKSYPGTLGQAKYDELMKKMGWA
jgi:hypothetical protein